MVIVKIEFPTEIRRLRFDDFKSLHAYVQRKCKDEKFSLVYIDKDRDWICLEDDDEWSECLEYLDILDLELHVRVKTQTNPIPPICSAPKDETTDPKFLTASQRMEKLNKLMQIE